MSASITNTFITQFESEVHIAYQRAGSKIAGLVRKKAVKGLDVKFFKAGKGTAGTKTRHGLVPTMNVDHNSVTATMADFYAADYVDDLDELKFDIDERRVIAGAGAMALGRKTDELLVTAMSAATTNALIAAAATGLTQTKINTTFERFGNQDVPDDGQRYFFVGPEGWTDLLAISAFSDADFIGSNDLPYKGGMVAKQWMGFTFIGFSGLAAGAGGATEARALAWHRSAEGLGVGKEVSTSIDWVAERSSNLISSKMSMGCVNIDETGIQAIDYVK
jgi:hypothetical protein